MYAGALAWSGNYKLSFQVSETGNLDIVVGMNPFASSFILEPGEEIKTPEIIWSYSSIGKIAFLRISIIGVGVMH